MSERDKVVKVVRDSFGYLEQELGYELTDVVEDQREREVSISFARWPAFVRVCCTAPCSVSVQVGRFASQEADTTRRVAENYWHIYLVRDAHPEDEGQLVTLVQEDAGLRKVLAAFAASLRRSGWDLLEGDYSRATRLKRLRAEDERRANQEEWGTSTGETPRFSTRPTLEQLFADATNDGIREARCYQAVWDYHFSLAELATFLAIDEEGVQRLLDQWERI